MPFQPKTSASILLLAAWLTADTSASPNLLTNPSFEAGAAGWSLQGPAVVQTAPWAASAGGSGVWFQGFQPGAASAEQTVVAPSDGDYVLLYDTKVEPNFAAVSNGLAVSLTAPGSAASAGAAPTLGGGFSPNVLTLSGVGAGDPLTVAAESVNQGGSGPLRSAMFDNAYLGLATDLRSTPLFDGERRDFDNQAALLNNFGGGFSRGSTNSLTLQSDVVRSGSSAYRVELGATTAGQAKFFQTFAAEFKPLDRRNTRDLGYFDALETYVRNDTGSDVSLTIELKDYRDSISHSATKQFVVPAGGAWSPVATSLDLSDGWSVNGSPQLDRAYAVSFVLSPQQSIAGGSLYFDDARLIEPGPALNPLTAPIGQVAEALAERTFRGLWGQRSRHSGLVPNVSTDADTGALNTTTGVVWTLPSAVRRGWVSQSEADAYMSQLSDTMLFNLGGTDYVPSRFLDLATGGDSLEESSIDSAFLAIAMHQYKLQPGVDAAVAEKVDNTVNQFNFAAFEAPNGWRLAYRQGQGFTTGVYDGYTSEGKVISLAAELSDDHHVGLEEHWHSDTFRTLDSLADGDNDIVVYGGTDHRAPFSQALINLFLDVSDRGLDTYPNAALRANSWQNFKDFEEDSGEYLAQQDRPYFVQPDAARGGPPSGYAAYSLYNLRPAGGETNEDLFMPWSAALALLSGDPAAEYALRFLLQSDLHGPLGLADGARWDTGADSPSLVNALQDNWNSTLALMALMRFIDGPDSGARFLADLPQVSDALDNLFFGRMPGDYDLNGVIDLDDYLAWTRAYATGDLTADGNLDGRVDAADYTVWRDAFDAANPAAVPEPGALVLASLAIVVATQRRSPR